MAFAGVAYRANRDADPTGNRRVCCMLIERTRGLAAAAVMAAALAVAGAARTPPTRVHRRAPATPSPTPTTVCRCRIPEW